MRFPNILRAVENGPALGQAGSAAAMACAFSLRFLNLIFLAVYSPPPANPGRQRRGWRGTNCRSDRPELSLVGQHQELVLNFDLKVKKKLC